ncbi:aldehyde dehydrogenase family protein [Rhodococcus artemisiae]|uniref:Aldehyde dehydrogenase family protein n=1 Tax=Rhodococcus artemisiae TaxID=714159 RepID=A0ABU7LAF1_9NOCA|nr:aldehyde dehydrogenase family protein [Rhodococcus artemisiae]MEE2058530.1 aldehyde dehydrogenase family protein [Rhodococcus artemisiae]
MSEVVESSEVGGPEVGSSETETSVELGQRVAARAETRLLIDGELTEAADGATYRNTAPATGLVLGDAAAATARDMDRAIGAARRAFDETGWSTDRALRKRCLLQLQAALESEKDHLREELVAEVGCPTMATGDAQLDWPLTESLRWPAAMVDDFEWERTLAGGGLFGPRNRRVVVKEAAGVVAAITPSNYPIEVILNKIGPALAAGNTVVLKPDPNTPWNAARLARLVAEKTDIPAGVLNVVTTPDNEVAGMLVDDPRVDLISFTGSTSVGRMLMRRGAATMKRMFLELGGKSALIVTDDADPVKAIMSTIGACSHAGQACAVNTRILVHRSLFDQVSVGAAEAYRQVPVGDPVLPETFVGPLISASQKQKVLDLLARARDGGAHFLAGGGEMDGLAEHLRGGNFVAPTLVTGLGNDAELAREEVFGPVALLIPFDTDDEAVRMANDNPFGLAGAVMSGSSERGNAIARRVRTGAIGVNGGMFYGADAPFGGYKNSGLGRQCGTEGFEQYLETKTIAERLPRGAV